MAPPGEKIMIVTRFKGFFDKIFWVKQTPSGDFKYRKRSKAVFTILSVVLAVSLYKFLTMIQGIKGGPEIIVVLAFGIIVLMVALILLIIIITLIEYLQDFE